MMKKAWKVLKEFLQKKIAVWVLLMFVVLVGGGATFGLVRGSFQGNNTQQTTVYSSVKKLEKVREVVFLNAGIQKVLTPEEDTKIFGKSVPWSKKTALIIINYTAKFGIKEDVTIREESTHHYTVTLPKYEVIGVELDKDNPYELFDTKGGLLSFSTKDIDTGEETVKALSTNEQEKYLKDNSKLLDESSKAYYNSLIKSIDPEATVEVISNSGK